MSFRFRITPRFDRALRKLRKRYPHIGADMVPAFEQIETAPTIGVVIPDDFAIRKLRAASSDMQRGKSGGFRVLYKLMQDDADTLSAVMLFVYAKTDLEDVAATFLELLNDESQPDEPE